MMRATLNLRILILAGAVSAAGNREACAQNRNTSSARNRMNQMIQNVQKDIAAVQKQLKEAEPQWNSASQQLGQAQASFKSAAADVNRAKKTQQERIGPTVGLPDAVAAAERAHADYETATAKAVAQLQSTPKFQELKQQLDEATARSEALRKEHASRDKLAEASKAQIKARDAYRSFLDHDPPVKSALEQVTQAAERLKDARAKYHQETKNDSELQSAETLFKQSKQALQKAQVQFAAIDEKIAMLQSRLIANHELIGR